MNLFSEIEKKSGETLSSSVLAYLLYRSPAIRDAVVELISLASVVGPITINYQFSCLTEVATADEDPHEGSPVRGRIDLILETDDAVVGIENKFNASFERDQPGKYISSVKRYAKDLGKARLGSSIRPLIVVLAPESRKNEIISHLSGLDEICCFLSWEKLLSSMMKKLPELDPGDAHLVRELNSYVASHIGFPDAVKIMIPHLKKKWEPWGTKIQRVVRDTLWSIWPEELRNEWSRGSGQSYCGYYFGASADSQSWSWYGFIDSSFIEDPTNECQSPACFMIATKMNLNNGFTGTESNLVAVKLPGWNRHGWACWIVEFDDRWTNHADWEKAIGPFAKALKASRGCG